MASEWRKWQLEEVAKSLDNLRVPVKEAERENGPYPYYGASGIVDYISKYIFDGEYLLVSEDGENLKTRKTPIAFIASGKFWVNNHAHVLRGNENALTKYLGYYIENSDIAGYLSGSAMPKLTQGRLLSFELVLPSVERQQIIVDILSAFDDKIELNRRMNRTLEQMARALFRSWFVDFDPVRAKMRGEQPEGMDTETAALFPDELVEVEGREVPKGWEYASFDSSLTIFGGGTPKTTNPDFWGGDIPWYSVVDVPSDGDVWVSQTEKTITLAGLEGSATRLLPTGTTIISARGTVGKLALTAESMAMNQSCYGLFPRDGKSVNFTYFSTLAVVDELKRRTHGAVFDTITRGTLQSVVSVAPGPEVLAAFETVSAQLTDSILSNVRESARLAQLRDALLPRLLSGELDVSGWAEEALVQEALA